MTATSFTPGPWSITDDFHNPNNIYQEKTYPLFRCMVTPQGDCYRGSAATLQSAEHIDGISVEETQANAHLIAASPEMYEALQEACTSLVIISDQVREAAHSDHKWSGVSEKLLRYAREGQAVLAKARGEAQ
ncbi:hypothetical protein [Roseibium alexandrii]|uniref:Uncharacterized protein n=1 Tax=Roseibium alexandrii TaxID=388408 RepID=A0A0M6ZYT2_9HYPH|nr:hypothetical protein [Roseibium alexandrii]CTQ67200.1 hypothetical protein LAX5112_01263 [Roseibium alexandrii]